MVELAYDELMMFKQGVQKGGMERFAAFWTLTTRRVIEIRTHYQESTVPQAFPVK